MKNFGRFTYYGSLGGYSHVWSTTDPPIYGARILLNEAGNTYVALRGDEHPEPTSEEIAEARALVVSKNFGRFIYHGSFSGHSHVWSTTNPPACGARIALSEDGSLDHTAPGGITYPAPTAEEVATAQAMVKPTAPKPEWDFGRFKYRGKFEIQNNYMPIESKHTWVTEEPLGAKIGLREDGSLSFTCETNGHPEPTAFEIAKAQSLVKHELAGERIQDIPMRTSSKSVRGSSPNIQRMLRTPRERTRIPDFSRLGSVVGSPLIHPYPQNFGRFIYQRNLGPDHFWATNSDSTDVAYISVNPDGTLNQSGAQGVSVKAPTKEEIDTARNMVLSANLVKQVEEGERPVIRNTAFYKNPESTKKWSFGSIEPPVDVGGAYSNIF